MRSSRGVKVSRPKRTYRKALLHVVVVLVAIAALFVLLSSLFIPKDNTKAAGMIDASANGVLGEPDNSIDMIIVGDSKAYSGISPMTMWEDHGIASYACTTKAQKLPYAFSLLKRATKAQTPSVVIMETNEFYTEVGVNDVAKRAIQDFLPVLEYHDRWKSLTLRDLDPRISYTWTDDFKGYYMNGDMQPADTTGYMTPTDEVEAMPRINRWIVTSMIEHCRQIGAQPVLLSVPTTKNWTMAKHNGIQAFADEIGVDFIDLNVGPEKVDVGIDWQTDTRDEGDHLNVWGAIKVSSYLGGLMSQAYGLPDHRGDPAYSAWDESLRVYTARVGWFTVIPSTAFPADWTSSV